MKVELIKNQGPAYFRAVEEGKQIGLANFHITQGKMVITHVEVLPSHRGGGRAKDLMMHMVEYARSNDLKIVPICPYARVTFDRYPEIRDTLWKAQG